MSKAINTVKAFIALNTNAVAAATKVFAAIESQSDVWVESLAKAGIMGADIKVYAVVYVSEQSGKVPKPSQRGGLTFDKGSVEYNRTEYQERVASGAAAAKAAKRSSGKTDLVAKALKAYSDLSSAQKRQFKAQI